MVLYLIFRATAWFIGSVIIMNSYTNISNLSLSLLIFVLSILCDYGYLLIKALHNIYVGTKYFRKTGNNLPGVVYYYIQGVFSFVGLIITLLVFIISVFGIMNMLILKDSTILFNSATGNFQGWHISTVSLRNILIVICGMSFFELNFKIDREKSFSTTPQEAN